jgi:hypothetical protein
MPALLTRKVKTVNRNARPGLLERNASKDLSPFMYKAVDMIAIDDSRRNREAKRTKSRVERDGSKAVGASLPISKH